MTHTLGKWKACATHHPAEGWKYFGQREGTLEVLWAKERHWEYFGQREGMLKVLWAKGRPLLLPGQPSAGSTLGKGKALAGHLYSHTLPLCSVQLKHSEDYDTVSAWWVIFMFL